jgi:hypothetical protein
MRLPKGWVSTGIMSQKEERLYRMGWRRAKEEKVRWIDGWKGEVYKRGFFDRGYLTYIGANAHIAEHESAC